MNTKKKIYQ